MLFLSMIMFLVLVLVHVLFLDRLSVLYCLLGLSDAEPDESLFGKICSHGCERVLYLCCTCSMTGFFLTNDAALPVQRGF